MGEALRLIVALAAWEQLRELLLLSASVISATMCWLIWRAIKRSRMASYGVVFDAQLDECTYALRLSVRNGSDSALVIDKIAVGSLWAVKLDADGPTKPAALLREGWVKIVKVWQPLSIDERWQTNLLVRHSDERLRGQMSVKLDVRVCDRRVRRKRKKVTVLLPRKKEPTVC